MLQLSIVVTPSVKYGVMPKYLCIYVVIGLAVLHPALNAHFVSDDFQLISALRDGGPFAIWTYRGGFFRPVVSVSLYLDSIIGGLNAFYWHAINILMHSVNAMLVMTFTQRIVSSRLSCVLKRAVGVLAGILYLLHGSHSETVAWISGRTDLVAAFFVLLSMNCLLAYLNRPSLLRCIATSMLCALAMLSKESAIMLPFILIIILVGSILNTAGRCIPVGSIRLIISLLLLVPLYVAVRYFFVGEFVGGYGANKHLSFSAVRIVAVASSYAFRSIAPTLSDSSVFVNVLSVACIVSVGIFVFRLVKNSGKNDWYIAGTLLLCFVVSTLPAISLGTSLFDSQGERFIYIPSIFISILIAYAVCRKPLRIVVKVSISLYIIIHSYSLHTSARHWKDAGQLAEAILQQIDELNLSGPVDFLCVPDNIKGAYVFRNGLPEGVSMFCGNRVDVGVNSLYGSKGAETKVSVVCSGATRYVSFSGAASLVPNVSRRSRRILNITDHGNSVLLWDKMSESDYAVKMKKDNYSQWYFISGDKVVSINGHRGPP